MGTTTLKLEGTNGDLKEITTTEENYLAYQAGLHLSALDSSAVGTLTASSTNNTLIGTYTDTTFDDAVGTHGFASGNVPVIQTTTSLYQKKVSLTLRVTPMHLDILLSLMIIVEQVRFMNLIPQK